MGSTIVVIKEIMCYFMYYWIPHASKWSYILAAVPRAFWMQKNISERQKRLSHLKYHYTVPLAQKLYYHSNEGVATPSYLL